MSAADTPRGSIWLLSTIPGLKEELYSRVSELHDIVELALSDGNGESSSLLTVVGDDSKNAFQHASAQTVELVVTDPALFVKVASRLTRRQKALPRLKLIQLTWAGVNALARNETFRAIVEEAGAEALPIARLAGVFGQPMAEYVVGAIISIERQFLQFSRAKKWSQAGFSYRTFAELQVTVLGGAGDIGGVIVQRLLAFGCTNLRVYRRTNDKASDIPNSALTVSTDLEQALEGSDYVISILPETPETIGLLNEENLSVVSDGASLINVGRGSVVSDEVLRVLLDRRKLGFVWIDVHSPEPVPEESWLWSHDRVFVSPHVSALSRPSDVAGLVEKQLAQHGPPLHVVSWDRGY